MKPLQTKSRRKQAVHLWKRISDRLLKTMHWIILLLFYLPLFTDTLNAQIIHLDVVKNPEDIRIEKIEEFGFYSDLLVDKYGFIWFSSIINGLKCYDGYETRSFAHNGNDPTSIPDNKVNTLYEDKSGNLWVSTNRGFCRFNRAAETFTRFFPDSSRHANEENHVYFIREDSKGLFWVFTDAGLFTFNPVSELFTSYQAEVDIGRPFNARFNNYYAENTFYEDEESNIWICGVHCPYKFNRTSGKFRSFMYNHEDGSGIYEESLSAIKADQEGTIWISSFGWGVFKLIDEPSGLFRNFRHNPHKSESLIRDTIYSIRCNPNGDLWFLTLNGFSRYNEEDESFTNFRVDIQQDELRGYPVLFDYTIGPDGIMWFCGLNGFYRFDPKSNEVVFVNEMRGEPISPISYLVDIKVSKEGIVWILDQSYLFKIDNYMKPFQNLSQSLSDATGNESWSALSVAEDRSGLLWVGTQDKGLYVGIRQGNGYRFYSCPVYYKRIPIPEFRVFDISIDKKGQVWLAGSDGLWRLIIPSDYDPKDDPALNIEVFRLAEGNTSLRYVIEDSKGKIWTCGPHGISVLDSESGILKPCLRDPDDFAVDSSFTHKDILWIYEDLDGMIWMGSFTSGLYRYDLADSSLSKFTYIPGDPSTIQDIYPRSGINDRWGRLWFSTYRGLNLFNPEDETFTFYGAESGLDAEMLGGLFSDEHGNLWISHKTGISRMLLSDDSTYLKEPVFQNFDSDDGIEGLNFYRNCSFMTSSGIIYFGGVDGLVRFHPDSIRLKAEIPPVYITSVHTEYCADCENGYRRRYFDKPIQELDEIHLRSKDKVFSFEFVALNYTSSQKNQYAYMLEGFEDDWVYCGTRREVRYTNIAPGKYTFRVKASNNDGIWNEEGALLDLIIHPPWYRTMVAYILYVLLIVAGIFGYIRWRTYRLKMDKEQLETEVGLRTATIEEQKEEILTVNQELLEQKEEILSANTQLFEQKEELEQQKEELQLTLDNLKEAQAQLIQSEKLAALGGLVAGVAHEINTPVGISVTAASSLVEETKKMAEHYRTNKISRAEFKEYLNAANQSAKLILSNMERAASMVQSFKQVSVDQSTEQKRRFNLKEYTEDVIRSLYPKLKDKKIDIKVDIDEKLELDSYPGAYSQLLTNLILNSFVHGFEGREEGKIELLAKTDNKELVLEYSDNGRGIPREIIPKIFDPFFTTDKKAGTGLGLHIVYNLVTQKLNGRINYTSSPNEGARFSVQIPLSK
jgi:signal transduction histidine kinase/streptogramin lyase